MKRVAVIGAGLSGLVVARQLSKVASVTLFEKSRGVAGRMATRDATPYQFDHGAQYFTVSTSAFKAFLAPLISAGHVGQWDAAIAILDQDHGSVTQNSVERRAIYVAIPKMNQLGKCLASGLNIHLRAHVMRLDRVQDGWQLFDDGNQSLGTFDWVVCAIPSAQCAQLMPADFKFMSIIKQQEMQGCFALMLGFKEPLNLPWQALKVTHSAVSWICVNSDKPGRRRDYSLLLHSSNHWAQTHIQDDLLSVEQMLITELESILQRDISHYDHSALHRWRYAKAEGLDGERILLDTELQLGACGDWCANGTVEGAFTSANRLTSQLSTFL